MKRYLLNFIETISENNSWERVGDHRIKFTEIRILTIKKKKIDRNYLG